MLLFGALNHEEDSASRQTHPRFEVSHVEYIVDLNNSIYTSPRPGIDNANTSHIIPTARSECLVSLMINALYSKSSHFVSLPCFRHSRRPLFQRTISIYPLAILSQQLSDFTATCSYCLLICHYVSISNNSVHDLAPLVCHERLALCMTYSELRAAGYSANLHCHETK